MVADNEWTAPYMGITHLGLKAPRVSVMDWGTWAELKCWFPGCGFNPLRSVHDTAEAARTAGEAWMVLQRGPAFKALPFNPSRVRRTLKSTR